MAQNKPKNAPPPSSIERRRRIIIVLVWCVLITEVVTFAVVIGPGSFHHLLQVDLQRTHDKPHLDHVLVPVGVPVLRQLVPADVKVEKVALIELDVPLEGGVLLAATVRVAEVGFKLKAIKND